MNADREWNLIERITVGDFNPDQPRDEEGKWTDTGAGSKSSEQDRKEKQLAIIQKYNSKDYDINPGATWVESVKDILTWEQCMYESDFAECDVAPDFTWDDAQKAKDRGWVMVYSSYPIKQGVFVSPSKMIAESYSGTGKVYSKKVKLDDVAWIDTSEGQLAEI